ncbi:hypothetical protein I4U23_029483 [Adineta vaga]|nr:hypothetical protein I4U23_029483 [Adineta vaga]
MTGTLNGYLINRETNAFYHEILATVAMALCGKEHVMNCIRDNNQLEKNGTLIKIMVFVMLFSSNCSIVMYTGVPIWDNVEFSGISSCSECVCDNAVEIYDVFVWTR